MNYTSFPVPFPLVKAVWLSYGHWNFGKREACHFLAWPIWISLAWSFTRSSMLPIEVWAEDGEQWRPSWAFGWQHEEQPGSEHGTVTQVRTKVPAWVFGHWQCKTLLTAVHSTIQKHSGISKILGYIKCTWVTLNPPARYEKRKGNVTEQMGR